MECDWIFIRHDHSQKEATLQEQKAPSPGDGKLFEDVGYEVVYVVNGRTTRPGIPVAIAVEFVQKS